MMRMGFPKLGEHFETTSGELDFSLDRLVRIGHSIMAGAAAAIARGELFTNSSGAFSLTRILVSKSIPAEKPEDS